MVFSRASLLTLGTLVCAPAPGLAYQTLADVEGSATPIVWSEPPTVALDVSGLTEEVRELIGVELQASIGEWNSARCTDHPLLTLANASSAEVVVRMVPDWTERGFEADAAGSTDLVLESTASGSAIVAATLSLNGSLQWGAHPQDEPDVRDLRAVLVHELGHVLGLAHSQDARATMAPTYQGSAQADLGDDDIAGICSLYSASPPPPPSCRVDAECPAGHWCVDDECAPDLRYGAECTDGSDCIGARCVEVASGVGACTYLCEEDGDCPSATRCLPVEGRQRERVCAMAGGGCSVSRPDGRPPLASISLLLLLLAFCLLRRGRVPRHPLLLAAAASVLAGCGTAHAPGDAGGDGGAADAGRDVDSATPPPDGSTPMDAGPAPVCEPGEMRVAPCGFCGTEGQACDEAGQWMATSECLGQGECAVGTVETRDLAMCAQEQRLCLDGCTWSEWEPSRGPGVCDPGDTRSSDESCTSGGTRDEVCSDACEWVGTSPCVIPCGVIPRTTPEWEREVCVPAGNFFRGSLTYADTQPIHEIYVSSFLIDAYPVTIRRYRACVDAGVCTPSSHPAYDLPGRLDYPIQEVTRTQATTFCSWDGGRRLPTEAEWEKAARGPSPRMNPFPWEGTSWDCSMVINPSCPAYMFPPSAESEWAADPYNGLPGTRSYYGTYLQVAGIQELVADYYHDEWYSNPLSLVPDPVATADDSLPGQDWQAARGSLRRTLSLELTHRLAWNVTFRETADEVTGFRCARSAP